MVIVGLGGAEKMVGTAVLVVKTPLLAAGTAISVVRVPPSVVKTPTSVMKAPPAVVRTPHIVGGESRSGALLFYELFGTDCR